MTSLPPDTAVLTANFGDPGWTRLLRDRVRECLPELPDQRFYVIDQNRTDQSDAALRRVLPGVRILRFPQSAPHVQATGHDHAHVLNLAVRELTHDYLIVIDSDAHPVSSAIRPLLMPLLTEHDAVLAARHPTGSQSHPCFMALGPRIPRDRLLFDEEQLNAGTDTGRTIFRQLTALGLDAHLLRPEPAFGGVWGTFFLGTTIYHHGSGSFEHSDNPRLIAQQATWRRRERFARRHVFSHRYQLSPIERAFFAASSRLAGGKRRAADAVASARRR
jgi:hypothetical protein